MPAGKLLSTIRDRERESLLCAEIAIVFAANARADAALVVDAAVASVRLRATSDPSVIAAIEAG